jgi:hypothetical protein
LVRFVFILPNRSGMHVETVDPAKLGQTFPTATKQNTSLFKAWQVAMVGWYRLLNVLLIEAPIDEVSVLQL